MSQRRANCWGRKGQLDGNKGFPGKGLLICPLDTGAQHEPCL